MKIKSLLYEQIEHWRPIAFWSRYEVSDLGNVRRTDDHSPVAQWKHTGKGTTYLRVTLRQGRRRKNFRVHRLVAMAFVPNPEHLPEVDHKDKDTFNNRADNLEWVTSSQNKYRRYADY